MSSVVLLFPNQLVDDHELYHLHCPIYMIEEYNYFRVVNFHKIKIAYHRASMKSHAARLQAKGLQVHYIESHSDLALVDRLIDKLAKNGIQKVYYMNPSDAQLEHRITDAITHNKLTSQEFENDLFINQRSDLKSFFKPTKKSFFQTSFYKQQRRTLNIMIDHQDKPLGDKWSYDQENRKKYPKKKIAPDLPALSTDSFWEDAIQYTQTYYSTNLGELSQAPLYPYQTEKIDEWLTLFFTERFHDFGAYEDAMVTHHRTLHHSVLSPMMNIGLIKPLDIVHKAVKYAQENNIPINSLEGFVRQIIGWREFIRGMYEHKGHISRLSNFWNFHRKIPSSFYEGTTGIDPVDHVIKSVMETGYCHHIERLMVLGNFMLLSEFHPNEVYRWFMELFIDAYDWVMVPNIYGMSQFADGGLFATKPYISGSNYLMKMSNYKKGDWQAVWDGLYWRFIDQRRDFFMKNPRLSMMVRMYDKLSPEKRQTHHMHAMSWLSQL